MKRRQGFDRVAFYEMVWTKPLTQLAEELGVSDVALHKICRKHKIPHPPRGWWAQVAAGRKGKSIPLPRLTAKEAGEIVVTSDPGLRQTPAVREAVKKARQAPPSGAVLNVDHPVLARTLARLQSQRPPSAGERKSVQGRGLLTVAVGPESEARLPALLPALLNAAEGQGFELRGTSDGAIFRDQDGNEVSIRVCELFHRSAPGQQLSDKHFRNDPTIVNDNVWHLCGRLAIELSHGPRRAFRDSHNRNVESLVDQVAASMTVAVAAAIDAKRIAAERAAYWERYQLERERESRMKHVEARRSKALDAILGEVEGAERLERLLASLRGEIGSPRMAEFLSWAERTALARREQISPASLEQRFDRENLFGDADDADWSPYRSW